MEFCALNYCSRVRLVHNENFHVPLAIANHGFGAQPQTRSEPPPVMSITQNSAQNGTTSSLTTQKTIQERYSFNHCPLAHESKLRPSAFCFLTQDPLLVQPFVCPDLKQPERLWHLTSDHWGWASNTWIWQLSNTSCGRRMPASFARRRPDWQHITFIHYVVGLSCLHLSSILL